MPPTFSLPGGGAIPGAIGTYYAGTYVDNEKTTESIKELLEGMNDSPPPKRGRKKKAKKVVADDDKELAALLAKKGSLVDGEAVDGVGEEGEDGEEGEEGEEEEEEEDLSVVEGLNVTLLPHQIRGLAFLTSREEGKARGGILADDV